MGRKRNISQMKKLEKYTEKKNLNEMKTSKLPEQSSENSYKNSQGDVQINSVRTHTKDNEHSLKCRNY